LHGSSDEPKEAGKILALDSGRCSTPNVLGRPLQIARLEANVQASATVRAVRGQRLTRAATVRLPAQRGEAQRGHSGFRERESGFLERRDSRNARPGRQPAREGACHAHRAPTTRTSVERELAKLGMAEPSACRMRTRTCGPVPSRIPAHDALRLRRQESFSPRARLRRRPGLNRYGASSLR
jgi:hypothetical protein